MKIRQSCFFVLNPGKKKDILDIGEIRVTIVSF